MQATTMMTVRGMTAQGNLALQLARGLRWLAAIVWLGLAALLLVAEAAEAQTESTAALHVAATPEQVWRVLADFESWTAVFPSLVEVRAERLAGDRVRIRQTSRVAGRTVAYTVAGSAHAADGRLELALDPSEPHDVAELSYRWLVTAHPDGGSQIELRVRSRSGLPMPGFLERRVAAKTTSDNLAALAQAALQREATVVASR